jgi:hypothetical protein
MCLEITRKKLNPPNNLRKYLQKEMERVCSKEMGDENAILLL